MLRPLILIIIGLITAVSAYSQTFTITRIDRVADDLILHYDLKDSIKNHTYTINLYSSFDNFNAPLKSVSGDIGLEVIPGIDRKITWNAKTDLGSSFNGDVSMEVRGKVYIPFVKLDGFNDYRSFKRKKAYNITWSGGRGNSVLVFDLYKGDKKIASYPNIANVGHYTIKFEHVRAGSGYKLRISDSKNKDDVVYSGPFKIKAKVPLLVKALPVIGIGYLIYALSGNKTNEPQEIISPPEPKQ